MEDRRFGHEFARIAIHPPAAGMIQAKLTVNQPGDQYELEADRVSEQVMRMAGPNPKSAYSPSRISANNSKESDAPSIVHEVLRSSGQPLDTAARAFMEPRFGHDFSKVQVHTGARAADSARAVNAHAYTVGNHIVFGEGQFAPGNRAGQQLLAHELAHTTQQAGGAGPTMQRKIAVGAGVALDTKGFVTSKSGNVYTCPAVAKNSVWNEIFTSLLFSPRVFNVAGTTNAEANANFDKHITARAGIVDFASKKQYTFGAGSSFKMNPAFWIVDAMGWRLKPGVDRNAAIADLNVHPHEYAIACLAATQLTMEGGSKSPLTDDTGVTAGDWIPGDWGYITNTNFPANGIVGEEGENIIYVGKDNFWGHFGPGNTYQPLTGWFDEVKSWNNGAKIESYRTRPTIGLI